MDIFFQWIISKWENFYVGFMVRPFERAVHIRHGKLLRVCTPGFWFKLPFDVDMIVKVNVVSTTTNLPTQIVTTRDNASLVMGTVIRWRVREESVARLVLDLEDYEDVLRDTTLGMLAEGMAEMDWDGLDLSTATSTIREAVRRRMGKFGFDVEDLYITDVGEARTFRLVQGD